MTPTRLVLPDDFDERQAEIEAKGWFGGASLHHQGKTYLLSFYDPVRLSQEVEDELRRRDCFFEPNLIVVQAVTRGYIEKAIEELVRSGEVNTLRGTIDPPP